MPALLRAFFPYALVPQRGPSPLLNLQLLHLPLVLQTSAVPDLVSDDSHHRHNGGRQAEH